MPRGRRPTRGELEAGLHAHRGNLTRLAGVLGVSRPTLYKWIYQHDLTGVAGVASVDGRGTVDGKHTKNYGNSRTGLRPMLRGVEPVETDPRITTNIRMRDGIWRALRKLAIDRNTSASDLLERAAVEFLRKAENEQEQ